MGFSTSCGKVCGKNEFYTYFGFLFCTESQNSPFSLIIRPFSGPRSRRKLWRSFPQACGKRDCPLLIHKRPWTSSPSFPPIRGGKFSTATGFVSVRDEITRIPARFLGLVEVLHISSTANQRLLHTKARDSVKINPFPTRENRFSTFSMDTTDTTSGILM